MSQEIEFKFRVDDEAALGRFAAALGHDYEALEARLQSNTFFDSRDGRLREHGLALRLRIEGGEGIVTVKGKGVPRSEDGALVARLEVETTVPLAAAESVLRGEHTPLDLLAGAAGDDAQEALTLLQGALAEAPLITLGGFENGRTTLPPVELDVAGRIVPLVFELDRTTFPGRIDCEIEAEIGPDIEAGPLMEHLRTLLARADVAWSPAPSKLARFLEILATTR